MGVSRSFDFAELAFLWQNWNSPLNLATIALSFLIASRIGLSFLMVPVYFTFLFVYDVLYYRYSISVIDENETLRQGYNLGLLIDDKGSATGAGLDYGFNFYDGNFKKSRKQAQQDKFNYAWKKLGLKAGMTLIDFGCGCGDWLTYVKERGVIAIGINITEGQVQVCRERGLNVIWTDWKRIPTDKRLQELLYGKADVVTMWDTVEHYVPAKYLLNKQKQNEIYTMLFGVVQQCFKKDIAVGRAWTSCLHFRRTKMDFAQRWNNYILDKFHSGCYPKFDNRQLSANARNVGFKEVFERNLTEDYYMTSVLSPQHFGRLKFQFDFFRISALLATMLLDPNWLPRFFWLFSESWMDQFDPAKVEDSPMQLLWIMWEHDVRG